MCKYLFLFLLSVCFFIEACSVHEEKNKNLAKQYCGSCHLFPDPSLLDKTTWQKSVLPAMGKLLKAPYLEGNIFAESDRIAIHEKPDISSENWNAIIRYYLMHAPEKLPTQSRPVIKRTTKRFIALKQPAETFPLNTFIKIDPYNKWIYSATRDSVLSIVDGNLNLISRHNVYGVINDMNFSSSHDTRSTISIVTKMGMMDPNDLATGETESFRINESGNLSTKKIFDSLQRPVQTLVADLDADGRNDYLVCGFGNKEGSFFWMKNLGNEKFSKQMLRALPGAIKAYVEDVNNDLKPDIVVLFAQAKEGIYFFINQGGGRFEEKKVLEFPPVYGSTFFELVDFDNDGRKDILYTCGDNADYSNILKNYHGIYLFLNKGNFKFDQKYFFPLNGAFKALARDFDNDGDLDIAAISFFPDYKAQPSEGFVYLEQSHDLIFTPSSINEVQEGHWITMDAGDIDGDKDEDIVIGSLYIGSDRTFYKKPLFLLLKNQTSQSFTTGK